MGVSTRIEIVKPYYFPGEGATAAVRGYETKHGLIKDPFTVSTTTRWIAKFEFTGSVLDSPGKEGKSLSAERAPIVQNAVEQLQSQSTMASSSITQTHVIPQLKQNKKSSTVFQQDGAPPHYSNQVRTYLREQFSDERVIARGFPNFWPVRSPDLTPLDYWFGGMVKARVYHENKPKNLVELRARIEEEFARVTLEEVTHAVSHIAYRLQLVIEERGGFFPFVMPVYSHRKVKKKLDQEGIGHSVLQAVQMLNQGIREDADRKNATEVCRTPVTCKNGYEQPILERG
ncbi:hypothetical protein CLF_112380 [Clonorchis sinensis]|uniref:Uncharacterized protein n=1 Tax=Clonorchis sinensis TaxID=79923 RepID=G7YMG1_CLOSI|nr:hypothetical protein CLF_112380 [Clonorchis sinensis]